VKVRKAVIPAAGLGTRMLPATKSQPKEMLTIVDKPVIQYVVEDAVRSGIKDILIVIGKGKDAIKHHFDKDFENSYYLEKKGKLKELEELRRISSLANIHFTHQKELNGLGDAVRYGEEFVGKEPFAVLLGDTILEPKSKKPVLAQLIDVFDNHGSSVIALEEVPTDLVSRYGIMGGKQIENSTLYEVAQWIEKPHKDQAPSNLAIAGRYLFTPEIFKMLDKTTPGLNNEVQLTDAMRSLLLEQKMYGLRFEGKRYDIGNKLDFIKTNLLFGLHDKILGEDLRIWLENHKEL
jgi:UTP--glucose-1-phosphate uridylyltransferase